MATGTTTSTSGIISLALLALCGVVLLTGCRPTTITVDPSDPRSPQHEYRRDEIALLKLTADNIFRLEKQKAYSEIYDEYTSTGFRERIGRRNFMKMANCVETHLGGIVDMDERDYGFTRGTRNGQQVDKLIRNVLRSGENIREEILLTEEAVEYKLAGIYWHAKNKGFAACMKAIGPSSGLPVKSNGKNQDKPRPSQNTQG